MIAKRCRHGRKSVCIDASILSTRSGANIFMAGAKLVEEYSRLLVEGHRENCPWRNKGCDGMLTLSVRGILLTDS